MASNVYYQDYVDGTSRQVRRATRQGAPTKPDELKRRNPVMIRLTDVEFEEYNLAKNSSFLRASDFGALVIHLGIQQLFATDNCSKQ